MSARTRDSEKASEISKPQSEEMQDSGGSGEPGTRKSRRPKVIPSRLKD